MAPTMHATVAVLLLTKSCAATATIAHPYAKNLLIRVGLKYHLSSANISKSKYQNAWLFLNPRIQYGADVFVPHSFHTVSTRYRPFGNRIRLKKFINEKTNTNHHIILTVSYFSFSN